MCAVKNRFFHTGVVLNYMYHLVAKKILWCQKDVASIVCSHFTTAPQTTVYRKVTLTFLNSLYVINSVKVTLKNEIL